MAKKSDGKKGNAVNNGADQGQQIERAYVAPDGTVTIPRSEAKLKSVEVADVDLLLSFSDGSFVIIPNGALDAISGTPLSVVFNDNKSTLDNLFKKVGVSNHAKAGSLRVVSGNVDAPKTLDDTDVPKPPEKVPYTSNNISDNVAAPAPLAKVDKGTIAGAGQQYVDITDPVQPPVASRTSSYSGSPAPVKTIAPPTVVLTNDSGASKSDKITNDASLTISAAVLGATRAYSVDGGAVNNSYVAPNADGSHTVVVTDTDVAGDSASGSLTFILDRTIATPTVVLTNDNGSSISDKITNDASLTISAAAGDVIRTYSVDGGAAGTNYIIPGTDGSHTVVVTDTDVAGNSASGSLTFVLDRTIITPTVLLAVDSGTSSSDLVTNNALLTFSAAAGDVTRTYSVDGGAAGSSYIAPGTDGSHTVVVSDTDVAGNIASSSLTFILDRTIVTPTVVLTNDSGSNISDRITNDTSLTISSAAGDVTRTYSVDGGGAVSSYVAPNADGSHTVVVTDTDIAGNMATGNLTFTLDRTITTPTVLLAVDSGTSNSDLITNSASLTLSAAAGDVTRTYSVDGGTFGSSYIAPGTDGSHTVTVRDTDIAGNTATGNLTFTLDTTAPAAPTVSLVTDSGSNNSDRITSISTLKVDGIENGAIVEYSANGTTGWSSNAPDSSEGSNTIYVRQTDITGNISSSTGFAFTLDRTIATPTISLVVDSGTSSSDLITNSASLTFSTAAGDVIRTYSVDGGAAGSSYIAPNADGSHTVVVTDTDVAGNTATGYLTFVLDRTIVTPTLELTNDSGPNINDKITNDTSLTFSAAAGDVTRTYSVDGGAAGSSFSSPGTDGSHTITVRDTDIAGNTASGNITFTLDRTIATPTVSLAVDSGTSSTDLITNSASLTFSASAGDVTRTYSVDGGAVGSSYIAPGSDGSHTVTVIDTDIAGNTATGNITFTLDRTIATPTVSLAVDSGTNVTDLITNSASLTFSAAAGDVTRTYSVDDGAAGSSYIAPVSDGNHTVTVIDTDVAGNSATGNISFTLDTTAPASPAISLVIDSGSSSSDLITNNVNFSISSPPADVVNREYSIDGGSWSTNYSTLIPSLDGSHTVSVRDTDVAGNSASGSLSFVFDTAAPADIPEITSANDNIDPVQGIIANGGHTNDTTPTLSGRAEANSTVSIYDGAAFVKAESADGSGNWNYTAAPLGAGTNHSYTVVSTDAAGNSSAASAAYTLNIDAFVNPPVITTALDNVDPVKLDVASEGYTNDTTPTLTGTAEADSIITIYDGVALVATATADGSGDWSYTPTSLNNGSSHSYTATATNASGNVSTASAAYVLNIDTAATTPAITGVSDNISPILGNVVHGGYTNDTTPTLSGIAEANSSVSLYDGSVLVTTITADRSGSWSYTPEALSNGSDHSYTIICTDTAGNVSAASAVYALHIDTTAPVVPAITVVLDNVDLFQGNIINGGYTNDPTPTLSGTAEANSTVSIYDGAALVNTTTADGSGAWSYTADPLGDDTTHNYSVTATDAAGNVSTASVSYNLHIDTTVPVAPVISGAIDNVAPVLGIVANGGYTNDTTPTISGNAEANSSVSIYDGATLVNTTTADGSGAWSYTADPLGDGTTHNYTVTAADAAGNVSTASAFALHIDTTAPTVPVITGAVDNVDLIKGNVISGGYTNDATPTLTGTAEVNSSVNVYDGTILVGTSMADGSGVWSYTTAPLGNGEAHSYTVTAIDAAGNVSAASDVYTLNIDTYVPSPAITGADDNLDPVQGNVASGGRTNDTTPTLSGSAEADTIVTIYDGVTLVSSVTADGSGNWSYTLTPLDVKSDHSFTATATDAVGNVSAASVSFALHIDPTVQPPIITGVSDNTAPVQGNVASGGYTNDSTPTLIGIADSNSTIIVYDGFTQVGTSLADGSGAWSFTTSSLGDGTNHSFTVTATDTDGVVSAPSPVYVLSIDTTAPTVPAISEVADNVAPVGGNVPNNGDTNDTTPTVSGTAEANSLVTVYDNLTQVGTATANGSGAWSYTTSVALTENTGHSYTVTATDAAGNVSVASTSHNIHIDTIVPNTPIISGASDNITPVVGNVPTGGYTNETNPILSGTAEANSTVTIYDGAAPVGTALADNSGAWNYSTSILGDSTTHSYTVTATDAAGNVSVASDVYILHIDTTAPGIPQNTRALDDLGSIQGPIANNGATNDSTPTLVGTAEANSFITIKDNGVELDTVTPVKADGAGAWSYTPVDALTDNSDHNYTVNATDAAGNVSAPTTLYSFHVDTSAPTVPTNTGAVDNDFTALVTGAVLNGYTNDLTPVISGMAEANSRITIRDNGVDVDTGPPVTADSAGVWSYTPSLANGSSHSYTVTATDAVGNVSAPSADYVLHIDTTVSTPVITSFFDNVGPITGHKPSTTYTDDTTPTLWGTAEANSTVTIYEKISSTFYERGTAVANGSSIWEFTPAALSNNSSHIYFARATDLAGNFSGASSDYYVNIDTNIPLKPILIGNKGSTISSNVGAHLVSGSYTNDATPLLSNSDGLGLSTVTISDTYAGSTTILGTTTLNTYGFFYYTTVPLLDGEHSLTAIATSNISGVQSPVSAPYILNIDTVILPPTITHAVDNMDPIQGNVASGGYTNDTTPTLTGTAEANSIVSIHEGATIIGTATVNGSGNWSLTTPLLDIGTSHSYTATAIDTAGNTSTASNVYTLNIFPPVPIPVISGADDDVAPRLENVANGGYTNDTTPTLSGTTEINGTVTIYDNAVFAGTVTADGSGIWSYTIATPLGDGTLHSYTVTATDSFGNVSLASSPYDLHIDITAPTSPPTVALTIDSGQNITGTLTVRNVDANPLAEYSSNDTVWSNIVPTMIEGPNSIYVHDMDLAGNVSPSFRFDFIYGTGIITGDAGNNILVGSADDNTIVGGGGIDTLYGNLGNDTFIGGAGTEKMYGGSGTDTADYAGSVTAVTASLATGAGTGGYAAGDSFFGVENIIGSAGDDFLTGDGNANTLTGGAGDDILMGGIGADTLIGGANTFIGDTASYTGSVTAVTASLATGGTGGDAAGDTYSGIENLIGGAGNDTLTGDGNDNILMGGAAADTLDGGDGSDTASYANAAGPVTVALDKTYWFINTGDSAGDKFYSIENLTGSSHNDILIGDINDNILTGGVGNDTIYANQGLDSAYGGAGNDTIHVSSVYQPNLIDGGARDADVPNQGGNVLVLQDLVSGPYSLSSIANVTNIDTLNINGDGAATDIKITVQDVRNMVNNGAGSTLYINADNGDSLVLAAGETETHSALNTAPDGSHYIDYTITNTASAQSAQIQWHTA